MDKKYEKTLYLPDELVAEYEEMMQGKVDYDAKDLASYETVDSWQIDFGDGYMVDYVLRSGESEYNDPLSTEIVIFQGGCEFCYADTDADTFVGEHELENEDEGVTFVLRVKRLSEAESVCVETETMENQGKESFIVAYDGPDSSNSKVFRLENAARQYIEHAVKKMMREVKANGGYISSLVTTDNWSNAEVSAKSTADSIFNEYKWTMSKAENN